jgi:GNAT superfamily N-acetyltransferase
VRYIHAASLRVQAADVLTDEQIRAVSDYIYSEAYAAKLQRVYLLGAIVGGELVGTSGWSIGDDRGTTARISSVHVRPLFTSMGLGSQLLRAAEDAARTAGFSVYSARAMLNAVGFFEHHGYSIGSHGVCAIKPEITVQVAFMRKSHRSGDVSSRVEPVTSSAMTH